MDKVSSVLLHSFITSSKVNFSLSWNLLLNQMNVWCYPVVPRIIPLDSAEVCSVYLWNSGQVAV